MTTPYFLNTLPSSTAKLLAELQLLKPPFLSHFYLSGGTALSLHIGHRQSEDLDFFSQTEFDPRLLQSEISHLGSLTDTELAQGTLNTYLNQVKLQFLEYPYRLIRTTSNFQGIALSITRYIF